MMNNGLPEGKEVAMIMVEDIQGAPSIVTSKLATDKLGRMHVIIGYRRMTRRSVL